jgi:hypothetical protein
MLHRHLILDAIRDDVARRHGLEVHLIVGPHHTEGLLDAQVKRAAHAPRDMPTKGAQTARQQAFGLRLALLVRLAGFEGHNAQL